MSKLLCWLALFSREPPGTNNNPCPPKPLMVGKLNWISQVGCLCVHPPAVLAVGAGGELLELSKALLSLDTGLCPLSLLALQVVLRLQLLHTCTSGFLCSRTRLASWRDLLNKQIRNSWQTLAMSQGAYFNCNHILRHDEGIHISDVLNQRRFKAQWF